MTKLIVGGFKSIRERTEIPIAPLTFLFGPNSAGKSAVLMALKTLREKLGDHSLDEPRYARTMRLAIQGQGAHSYQHPRKGEDDEKLHEPITLGLAMDSFPAHDTVDPEDFMHEAHEMAIERFRVLDEKCVQLELVEVQAGLTFTGTVTVEGHELLGFVSSSVASDLDPGPFGLFGRDPRRNWGGLILQMGHSFWGSSELARCLNELKQVVVEARSPFIREMLILDDDDKLMIRTPTQAFQADGWGDLMDAGSLRDIGLPEWPVGDRSEVQRTMALVNSICTAVSFLVRNIRFTARRELEIAEVAGDRKILQEDDTSTEVDINGPAGRGSTIKHYAAWLGVVRAGNEVVPPEVMQAAEVIDDFVNDSLRLDFFPARHYQVKPEVLHVTTTGLLEREPEKWNSNAEHLRITLFLEDSNGRYLDFSEVGSGVSYVMPVLVSLWGADRSWIEQPELHLHPAAQCELGDVVIRAFNRGRFSIIETHSEHMLLRVLKRIRMTSEGKALDPELKCLPEAVSVLYFDPLPDGSTAIRQLRISRGGDFMDRWPAGFFEERDRELFDE